MTICVANLIPIFITLLVCGFLFIYFNSRLAEVKSAVEKQNRVLTAFITNVQNDIRGTCLIGSGPNLIAGVQQLASEEAINAVKRNEQNSNEKIVVSDDESESESESESGSESGSDSENDVDVFNVIETVHNGLESDVKIIKLQEVADIESAFLNDLGIETLIIVDSEIEPVEPVEVVCDAILSDTSVEESVKMVEPDHSAEVVSQDNNSNKSYDHAKVDDLRKIVSDKNLATKEEVKKLKKPELLSLLREN